MRVDRVAVGTRRVWLQAAVLVLLVYYLVTQHSFSQREEERQSIEVEDYYCPDVPRLVPFSSRGFARSCCTVFPKIYGKYTRAHESSSNVLELLQEGDKLLRPWSYRRSFFEGGVATDSHYFYRHPFSATETVYVVTPDLSAFISEVFLKLPASTRITLVTGSEDIGAPWEIFHPFNRTSYFDYNMAALWPRGQPVTMRSFISDPRLVRWYAQNYDLIGCNVYTCSDVGLHEKIILDKVRPLPIGLDLHSLSEKLVKDGDAAEIRALLCQQRQDLIQALSSGDGVVYRKFAERPLKVLAEFDCQFASSKGRELRQRSRGEVCRLLAREAGNPRYTFSSNSTAKLSGREAKLAFWTRVASSAFALAPPGFGMDTHRVWEILQMRTAPIVISSPLDALYLNFPVVIVRQWSEAFAPGALETFRADILARFGNEPFTGRVLHMLTADYWVRQINSTRAQALPPLTSVDVD